MNTQSAPRTTLTCWPGGHAHAITLSFDDGRSEDRMLVALLNRHGLKATFNLNSVPIGRPDRVCEAELTTLYAGHEIAAHTLTHPWLSRLSPEERLREIWEDRRALERMTGRIVSGMAYPFGECDEWLRGAASAAGLRYARTNRRNETFGLPEDWLEWNPTCHEKLADDGLFARFFAEPRWPELRLLHLYGHSFEFAEADRLKKFEETCHVLSEGRKAWHATNGEIWEYCDALGRLRFSADGWLIENPSAIDVWVAVDGHPRRLRPGFTVLGG